jgi:hypothetical protein
MAEIAKGDSNNRKVGTRWSKKAMGEISIIISMVFFGLSFTGQRFAMVKSTFLYQFQIQHRIHYFKIITYKTFAYINTFNRLKASLH